MTTPSTPPVHLPSQHASLHDLPTDPDTIRAVLADAVAAAIAHQQPDGNFEDPAADDDIGDMSLGVTSLLALCWQRGDRRDAELVSAARRSMDFFLRERVYRTDNPGEWFLRIRNSGAPYARYMPPTGDHPFGDWPSTVWAMLHAVNILELGEGLLTDEQYAELTEVALGYWRWLTEVSVYNPQQTANQAIGSIAGALMLARHLRRLSREDEAKRVADTAMTLYTNEIRAQRQVDRGYLLPQEHGAGHDQNYLPISLSFLAKAYLVSGEEMFVQDGEQIARHIDFRLSARGFDFGGPRYSEQHSGSEGLLGMRFFSNRIRSDLGRYLGDRRVAYYGTASTGAPSGHFAFTTVWWFSHVEDWFRADGAPRATRYSLRNGRTSISFTDTLTPYVLDAGGGAVIEAIVDQQHGIGPLISYPDGRQLLLTRPLGPMRSRDAADGAVTAKLITKAVVSAEQVALGVQQLFVSDGTHLYLFGVLDRTRVPADAHIYFLAGLPYLVAEGEQQRKITALGTPDGEFDLGQPNADQHTAGPVRANGLTISAPAGFRLVNPADVPTSFSSAGTIGLTLERASFNLADDPRGYGNPDSGWHRMVRTNLVLAEPLPVAPANIALFAVRYGPSADAFEVAVAGTDEGVEVRTPAFTALIGDPAGDAHGEPILRLTA